MDDHETRLLAALPARVRREQWINKLWSVLGSEEKAARAYEYAERDASRAPLSVNDALEAALDAVYVAAVRGVLTFESRVS